MFLALAGVTNIYNWTYFTLSIKTPLPAKRLFKKRCLKIANYSLIPVIMVAPVLYCIGFVWGCSLQTQHHEDKDNHMDYREVQRYFFIIGCTIFLMIAVGFIYTGKWLRYELKCYNEEVEHKVRCKLLYAS